MVESGFCFADHSGQRGKRVSSTFSNERTCVLQRIRQDGPFCCSLRSDYDNTPLTAFDSPVSPTRAIAFANGVLFESFGCRRAVTPGAARLCCQLVARIPRSDT